MYKVYKYNNISFDDMIVKRRIFNRLKDIISKNHPDKQYEFTTEMDVENNIITLKVWTGNLN